MEIRYSETKEFREADLAALFASVGWESGRYPDRLVRAMRASSHVISAWDGEKLVGLVRALEDGETVAFLHYLLVDPAYQGRGIGRGLMERIMAKLKNTLYVKIMPSDPKTRDFYRQFGFREYENYSAMVIKRFPQPGGDWAGSLAGYRGEVTGAGIYAYDRGEERVCQVTAHTLPDWPVHIEGPGCRWISRFDMDATLTPGLRRYIADAETGAEQAYIEYRRTGMFICCGGSETAVEREGENYAFTRNGRLVGRLRRTSDGDRRADIMGMNCPLYYTALYGPEVDRKLLLCMLAYPALRFA